MKTGEIIAEESKAIIDQLIHALGKDKILTADNNTNRYNERRIVNNRKFHFKPLAIAMCADTADVEKVVKLANINEIVLRVRSGGHDHEGECSATDAVVMDLSEMNTVRVDKAKMLARIGPACMFKDLIPALDDCGVSIPHGTCDTVCVGGYTFGGSWGPWTRKYGMGCERLAGATIVLGNGNTVKVKLGDDAHIPAELVEEIYGKATNKKKLTDKEKQKFLLWAMRGGGGMSYGIVTELVYKVFELPPVVTVFTVKWMQSPMYEVLKAWEKTIAWKASDALIGTNIKIVAIPQAMASKDVKKSVHYCQFNGYYAGNKQDAERDVRKWLGDKIFQQGHFEGDEYPSGGMPKHDAEKNNGTRRDHHISMFNKWDMVTTNEMQLIRSAVQQLRNPKLKAQENVYNNLYKRLDAIPPEKDPALPRKITSRLVNENKAEELIKSIINQLEKNIRKQIAQLWGKGDVASLVQELIRLVEGQATAIGKAVKMVNSSAPAPVIPDNVITKITDAISRCRKAIEQVAAPLKNTRDKNLVSSATDTVYEMIIDILYEHLLGEIAGLGVEGRKLLVCSLESSLVHFDKDDAEVRCYITLGAIRGPYYDEFIKSRKKLSDNSAFPYKRRAYTVQYQAWWNEPSDHNTVSRYANMAEDWIAECRSFHFPQTSGSFISFKDDAVSPAIISWSIMSC